MQLPYMENKEEHIAEILLLTENNSENIEQKKDYLQKIWKTRQHLLKIKPQTQDQTQD